MAIKILPAHLSSDPVRKQRFEREAKTISSLNHPNVCTIHDIGAQDGKAFIALEFLKGPTLKHHIARRPRERRLSRLARAKIAPEEKTAPGGSKMDGRVYTHRNVGCQNENSGTKLSRGGD